MDSGRGPVPKCLATNLMWRPFSAIFTPSKFGPLTSSSQIRKPHRLWGFLSLIPVPNSQDILRLDRGNDLFRHGCHTGLAWHFKQNVWNTRGIIEIAMVISRNCCWRNGTRTWIEVPEKTTTEVNRARTLSHQWSQVRNVSVCSASRQPTKSNPNTFAWSSSRGQKTPASLIPTTFSEPSNSLEKTHLELVALFLVIRQA